MTARIIPFFIRPRRSQELVIERAFLPAALEIVETPASPTIRLTAGLISLCLFSAIVWSYLGHVDIIATAPGKVIARSMTKVLQPYDTGVVRAIHVADGDIVKAGQLLVELDPTLSGADRTRFADLLSQARLDQARLNALLQSAAADPFKDVNARPDLIAAARAELAAQRLEQDAKLAKLNHETAERTAEKAGVSAEIAKIDAELPFVRERAAIRAYGLKTEFGNKLDYLQQRQQLVDMENERVAELRKRDEIGAALSETASDKARTEAEFRGGLLSDLAKANREAGEAEGELAKAAKKTDLETLTAPVGGRVQDLAVHTVGGVVTPAQQILRIVPSDGGLEVEATIGNEDVGFVEVGQQAEIKVDTFPFTRYGLIDGQVREIAADSVDQPQNDTRRQGSQSESDEPSSIERSRQLVYTAHIALRDTTLLVDGRRLNLQPGMSVTAEIKTGKRRVIDFLLSPFHRYTHDSLRER